MAVQFLNNPTSEMSADERNIVKNRTIESDESGHEVETEIDDKKFLDFALKTVLDPTTVIIKTNDRVDKLKHELEEIDKTNITLDKFMEEMDRLSLEVCQLSQKYLWEYVTDVSSDMKKNKMINIAAIEDEIKKKYWDILKQKYIIEQTSTNDLKLKRKFRIIKERGINVQMPHTQQREEIDTMQRIWSRVTVCAYNVTECNSEDSLLTMNDIISVFKTSDDTKELSYYWKAYRDATGKKILPIFKKYVIRMNNIAISEDFTDAGDMWRYSFEDDSFPETVNRLWSEIKPFYNVLHDYVRAKLRAQYGKEFGKTTTVIPAHLLGNIWAQDWQAIFNKVTFYPDIDGPKLIEHENVSSKDFFQAVDEFHQSLGFESAKETFQDVNDTAQISNCLPSSHDMCDGVNYKIKWCVDKVSDVRIGLSRAARLLGHIQYFKHYRNLQPLYRDGPNPAFHDAISDIVAVQVTSPKYLQTVNFVKVATTSESMVNHLLWLALEKFPLMAYAYVLDRWRWDIFANSNMKDWNKHWWDLRAEETGISPPVPRNVSDLDPAAKYHVASHVQFITYLISNILEFQILSSLCKAANHTGPLHECSLHGVKEAGSLLSEGMSLGASEDWRTVLKTITGETEISTEGILQYFAPLKDILQDETAKLKTAQDDMDTSAPIVVGIIVVILTLLMFIVYCVKKRKVVTNALSVCTFSKNGSLDIATHDVSQGKSNDISGIREDKV